MADFLANDWSPAHTPAEAPLPWKLEATIPAKPGVEGGAWFVATPYRAYVKPLSGNRLDPHIAPIAALEKIASDLAYVVKLPVPPVTLFTRSGALPGEPCHHAASAPPFDPLHTWQEACAAASAAAKVQADAVPVMSAMVAFDTWLECRDHDNHPNNLLVAFPRGLISSVNFAFIDYSYSMTHTWIAGGFQTNFVAPMYNRALAHQDVLREAIAEIEKVPDKVVREIVDRVPTAYLSDDHKNLIVRGLLYRRTHLKRIITSVHPGVSP